MNIFMFWINENGGKTVTSLNLGALTGLRDWRMVKCLEVHLCFSHFITYSSLKTFAIFHFNLSEIDELWSCCLKGWWKQVAIRPKEGGIYGNPLSGNNQIVCKQAHLSKFGWNLVGWRGGTNFPCTLPKVSVNSHKWAGSQANHQRRDNPECVSGTTYQMWYF